MKKHKTDLDVLESALKQAKKAWRNDPFRRGAKSGIDSALGYISQIREGKRHYDPLHDVMVNDDAL
jgi:hypothetical protein